MTKGDEKPARLKRPALLYQLSGCTHGVRAPKRPLGVAAPLGDTGAALGLARDAVPAFGRHVSPYQTIGLALKRRPSAHQCNLARGSSKAPCLLLASLMLMSTFLSVALPAARANEVWFAPMDPRAGLGTPDFMDLFRPGSPWPQAAGGTRVLKLYPQFVLNASPGDLRAAVDGIRSHGMKLALEFGMLTVGVRCGHLEGYGGLRVARDAISRLIAVGADLRYLAMDEPVWFGHRDLSPAACRSSISDIARDAAATAAAFRDSFPSVQVGDIEAVPKDAASMAADMEAFAAAWQAADGHALAFVAVDLGLDVPWVAAIQPVADMLRRHSIPLAIIYNGTGNDRTDAAWIGRAEQRYGAWEADARDPPAIALFQSWDAYPTRVLPESSPLSFTHLLRGYTRIRTEVRLSRDGTVLHGRLLNLAAEPPQGIGRAVLVVETVSVSGPGAAAWRTMSGTVPNGAASALFLIRVDDPECGCVAPAHIGLDSFRYSERLEGSQPRDANPSWPARATGPLRTYGSSLAIQTRSDETARLNSSNVPVQPGAAWTATFKMRASAASEGSGYVALAFLDKAGKEIRRTVHWVDASAVPYGVATTRQDGSFSLAKRAATGEAVRVRYEGSTKLRAAEVIVH